MIHEAMVFDQFADNSSLSHPGSLGLGASSFWYVSPMEFSDYFQDHEEPPFQEASFVADERKSFVINGGDENSAPDEDDDGDASFRKGEDKMDVLWEDFNDELGRASFIEKDKAGFNIAFSHTVLGYRFDAISPLKMSKRNNGTINRRRRPSLRIILKVLKKLLLLSRSRCPKTHDF